MSQLPDDPFYDPQLMRSEPDKGFVQYDDGCSHGQNRGERDHLAICGVEIVRVNVGAAFEFDELKRCLDALSWVVQRQCLYADGHLSSHRSFGELISGVLEHDRHVTNDVLHRSSGCRLVPDHDLAGARSQKTVRQLDQCALSSAIAPRQHRGTADRKRE